MIFISQDLDVNYFHYYYSVIVLRSSQCRDWGKGECIYITEVITFIWYISLSYYYMIMNYSDMVQTPFFLVFILFVTDTAFEL